MTMIRFLLVSTLLLIGFSSMVQAQNGPPFLKFDEFVYDFGHITEGTEVTHTFTFTNMSSDAITITEAKAGCGCTQPEFSKEPVMPGQKSSVKVTFRSAGKQGIQNKEIIVTTNVGDYKIFINCIVDKQPESKPSGTGKKN